MSNEPRKPAPHGIPTVYKGRQFRSRLESRWAAFFDLLGWKWEYEPFDLEGWIPDFLLAGANILVEVKPATERPDDIVAEIDACKGADGREILIVGCTIPVITHPIIETSDGIAIGWMRAEPMFWNKERGMTRVWTYGVVQTFLNPMRDVTTPYDGPMTREEALIGFGLYSGRDHILYADPGFTPHDDRLGGFASNRFRPGSDLEWWGIGYPDNKVIDLWARSGNLTQWRGKQSIVS